LSQAEFTKHVAGSYGSIRNTLVHIMSAEWGWLDRCGGHARGPKLNADDYPTLASIVARWASVEGHMREFFATLTDERLSHEIEFSFSPGQKERRTVGQLLQHSANHATHHRGQVSMLMRMLGHAPGDVDLLLFDTTSLPVERR
jgi:uncharacterized damage-inducible protein DinB